MIKVLIFAILVLLLNMIIGVWMAKLFGYDVGKKYAFINSIMFYNSANVGLPLITLIFSSAPYILDGQTPYLDLAITAQITVMAVQNITTNTIGFLNAGRASLHWKDSIKNIFKMPVIYAIPSAFILKLLPMDLTQSSIWPGLQYIRGGLVSIALITLGVQLSKTTFRIGDKDVYLSTVIRLMGGPILAFILIKLMGINGVLAQTLMVSSSVPTAVNTALIAVEYKNRPDFASQVVMTSTILSTITLSIIIYMARIIFPII